MKKYMRPNSEAQKATANTLLAGSYITEITPIYSETPYPDSCDSNKSSFLEFWDWLLSFIFCK